VALRTMARDFPRNSEESRRIPGVGEAKLREFGGGFLQVISDYLRAHPNVRPAETPTAPRPRPTDPVSSGASRALNDTADETLRLIDSGKTIEQIAQMRELTPGTIYQHVVAAIEAGRGLEIARFFDAGAQSEIAAAFTRFGPANLTGVFESLSGRYTYGELRIYRAFSARKESVSCGRVP
jgi:ATP-dependent DNA helicase RecQ